MLLLPSSLTFLHIGFCYVINPPVQCHMIKCVHQHDYICSTKLQYFVFYAAFLRGCIKRYTPFVCPSVQCLRFSWNRI